MFSNFYVQQRIKKMDLLRAQGLNPYTNLKQRTLNNADFLNKYAHLHNQADSESIHSQENQEWVAGRVRFIRMMGKACFIKIQDESGMLQAYLSKNDLEHSFETIKKILEVGDIVNICGYAFVTKTGELSIHALNFLILTKSLVPLPEKFHGLTDVELRYRQRYLDMIINEDVKKTFKLRGQIVSFTRRFFEQKGFLEVETPMLHPIPGGANARPFITHHNALSIDRYLRIAPELYLKRLIVGGFEAIFELNRNFRNEGMDHSHNPEFTTIEFYWAYKTYQDLIKLTQEFFINILYELGLPQILQYGDNQIDFSEFQVLTYKQAIEQIGGINQEIVNDYDQLLTYLQSHQLKVDSSMSYGKLLSKAFDEFTEHKLINPTFVTQYPIEISPLARRNDENPEVADRFEFFIGGKEIANGFSELNDPLDQFERFQEQVKAKNAGDEDAQYMDEDYVWALAHGMPPTAGQGIGIDRLVMILNNAKSIKDVILFPALKPTKTNFDIILETNQDKGNK